MTSRRSLSQFHAAYLAMFVFACMTGVLGCGDGHTSTDAGDGDASTDASQPGDAGADASADASDDASDASAVEPCTADTYVMAHVCVACPLGSTNAAGDDPDSTDTTCDPVLCEADSHVADHVCVTCSSGTTRPAGDDATGADTACSPILCGGNFHVVDHACVACAPGEGRDAGDDPTGDDTTCAPIVCETDFHVVDNACVACAPGSLRDAGDDATGDDTSCTATLCAENFHVVDHACVACPIGTRPAGDDATGSDTTCCGPAWGVGASVGSAAGEFQDAFVTTGSASSLSSTAWTALSVSDGNGMPGAAYWVRTTNGSSPGAYFIGQGALDSPSMANGVALFDSDYLDNGGTQGAFGTGTSAAPHRGELISPPIDLSAYEGGQLSVRLFNWHRNFQITSFSVSVSVDGGSTWGTPANLPLSVTNQSSAKAFTTLALGTFPASTDFSDVRIRVVFDGDYYFAMVDDVTLYVCE